MRIISGSRRGMNLFTLKGEHTRPTLDKVKESIFSMIQFEIEDAICLDMFAGSGAMGIEAISRGAKFVYFVDNNTSAIDIVRKNVQKARFEESARIISANSLSYVQSCKPTRFDIVFLDPPYKRGLITAAMQSLMEHDVLQPNALIVCEYHVEDDICEEYGHFKLFKSKKYSDTMVGIYKNEER